MKPFVMNPNTGVFTDGGASPNPGPGAWAYVIVNEGEVLKADSGYEASTTNNRMEFQALIQAYKALPQNYEGEVYSDSQLAVNTITQWAKGWAARGWKRKTGPVQNLDLVKELYALAQSVPGAKLKWVKAHAGIHWNEHVDTMVQNTRRAKGQ